MKKYLLFDLDGTLTDPKTGICTCVQYALSAFGIEEPDLDKLESFIGPPLKDSFMRFYGFTEEQVDAAIVKYRERFSDVGLFENEVYKGIPKMLRELNARGLVLAVASSKPTVYVQRILEHFRIARYFKAVVGSELDGRHVNKDEVVQEALGQLFGDRPVEADQVYMIGDRCFDVEGAHKNGVESVGVTYGYGSMEELKGARSDYIVRSVEELQEFLLRGTDESLPQTGVQRIWQLAYPILLFLLVRSAAVYLLQLILLLIVNLGFSSDALFIYDEAGALAGFTGDISALLSAVGYIAGAAAVYRTARRVTAVTARDMRLLHIKEEPRRSYVLLAASVVGMVLGVNLLLSLLHITDSSAAYQAVVKAQYSASLFAGLICYGIITPAAEELLFRGIVYGNLRRMIGLMPAMLVSSLLFGVYHGNPVQGVYAFVMGCLMVYFYEYFGSFWYPVGIHMAANLMVYSLSSAGFEMSGTVGALFCALCLLGAAYSIYLTSREKRVF